MRLLFKTFSYTFNLLYRSSNFLIFAYLLFQLVNAIIPLLSTYILRDILNIVASDISDVQKVLFYIGVYIISLLLMQANSSALNVCYGSLSKRAENQYFCDLSEKLMHLPMSFIDSSEGKNLIDEVRYLKTGQAKRKNQQK